MSLTDFMCCTPAEFRATFDCWNRQREQRERGEWERVRMQCLCSLQPYSKNKLRASDIMEFPWEKEGQEKEQAARGEVETVEEIQARFRAAKERYGLG